MVFSTFKSKAIRELAGMRAREINNERSDDLTATFLSKAGIAVMRLPCNRNYRSLKFLLSITN